MPTFTIRRWRGAKVEEEASFTVEANTREEALEAAEHVESATLNFQRIGTSIENTEDSITALTLGYTMRGVLSEFVNDVEAAHGTEAHALAFEWPDLHVTYRLAKKALGEPKSQPAAKVLREALAKWNECIADPDRDCSGADMVQWFFNTFVPAAQAAVCLEAEDRA